MLRSVSGTTISTAGGDNNPAHVLLQDLRLACGPAGALSLSQGSVELSDVLVQDCDELTAVARAALDASGGALHLDGVTCEGSAGYARLASVRGGTLEAHNLIVEGGTWAGGAVLSVESGTLSLEDVRFADLAASGPLVRGQDLEQADLTRVEVACSTASAPLIDLSGSSLELTALRAWKSAVRAGEPLVRLEGPTELAFATLLGSGDDTVLEHAGTGTITALASDGGVLDLSASEATVSWSVLGGGAQASGQGVLLESPALWSISPADRCDGDRVGPTPGGNLDDTGPPALRDADGTPADVGATGGPEGWPFYLDGDADGDGFLSLAAGGQDCDDLDPDTWPGAPEDLSAIDRNCDGYADPTDPLTLRGCSAAPAAAGLPLL
ncbi:MAG: putative metal-binding motif-containing protein, partial [Deltaproteobacteria bacterium]|nr:putative metal-binding motif-containing protein [Deltaproteobacteria bacterium]